MINGQLDVSVVVPHYNDLERLALCLTALDSQSYQRARYEIVVADNQSPCGLDAVASIAAGRARVISAVEPGAGPARNEGIKASQGKAIAFTDSDCVPDPNWLANGLRAMSEGDIVGGKVKVLVRNEDRLSATEAFERVFAFNNQRYVENEKFSVTANMFCKREHLIKFGGFRSAVSEDKEWCLRAHVEGLTIIYAGDAIVGHPARQNFNELLKKWRRINQESYFLVTRGPIGSLYWIGRTWLLIPSIIVHTITIVRSSELKDVKQKIGAISALVFIRIWRFLDGHRLLLYDRTR